MDGVEAMRPAHEIRRRLGRAADAAGLDDPLWFHTHLVHCIDDALRNSIVTAAGAQGGFAAAIVEDCQANTICLRGGGTGRCSGHCYLPSMVMISSVTERASS